MKMQQEKKHPRVGLGVIVTKDRKVLLGKRKGSHGSSTWCFPGGHLEYFETWEECARREVEEETGLRVDNIKFLTATNDIFKEEDKHYITIFVRADIISGEPRLMEPDKCTEWGWFAWDQLPKPLFIPTQNLVDTGFDPFRED